MPEQKWKSEAILDVIKLALAAGLFLSPWFLEFTTAAAASRNAWMCGAAVGLVSLAAIFAYAEWQEWVSLALGLWVAISPWVLGFHDTVSSATRAGVVVGIAIAAFTVAELWLLRHAPQRVTA